MCTCVSIEPYRFTSFDFYVYEFRRIQTRGEFNIYFRRSSDFFQSMVIP